MRTKTLVSVLLAVFLLPLFSIGSSYEAAAAQKKQKNQGVKEKGQKSRGASSTDENIKNDNETNDPNKVPPAPPDKGGTRSRGASVSTIYVKNYTGYYIRFYVDGDYRGTLGPYEDVYCHTYSGATRLYGVARFNDGSTTTWGPRTVNIYGSYTWSLTP